MRVTSEGSPRGPGNTTTSPGSGGPDEELPPDKELPVPNVDHALLLLVRAVLSVLDEVGVLMVGVVHHAERLSVSFETYP
mgnify:CR=1 FL=1